MNKGSRKYRAWNKLRNMFNEIRKLGTSPSNKWKVYPFKGECMASHVGFGAHKKLYLEKDRVIAQKYVNYEGGGNAMVEAEIRNSDCGRYVNILQTLSHHQWSCWQQVTLTVKDLERILKTVKRRQVNKKC